jgi:predicted Zn-dependent protease
MSSRTLPAICSVLLALTITLAADQELAPGLATRFTEGVAALKSGDLKAAERAFRDVLANGGERAFVHHNLGIVLQQHGQHEAALTEFRAAERLDPSFGPAWLLSGVSLLAVGRPRDAVSALEHAAELMPGEAAVHLQLADACERTGNVTGVIREYRRLVELGPSNEDYRYRLGKAYLKLAQQSYERLRTIAPGSARLAQALGDQYLEQNRPAMALEAFEQAARLGPSLPDVHLSLARIHLDEGRLNDAEVEVERERALVPDSAAARALQARIEAARKAR